MASDTTEPPASMQPLPGPPVEAMHARHIAKRALIIGPLIVAGFMVARGVDGGAAAAEALQECPVVRRIWTRTELLSESDAPFHRLYVNRLRAFSNSL